MTNKIFIVMLMIFCHIVDDYYLQGILASMKQKLWWTKQEQYVDKYKHDYIVALLMHAFSWAFMIMLPVAIACSFQISTLFIVMLFANMIVHCVVDDLKANKLKINLIQDQTIHMLQIVLTAIVLL